MFSLLSPFALWLAPLLAVPLVLALMGRARPAVRDFPSLLPVRASLQRAMKRHRLKNLLQLILRTLAIACLVLAAAGPVWRGCDRDTALSPPARAALLLPNNVYAAIPVRDAGSDGVSTEGDRLSILRAALDSLMGHRGNVLVEPVIPETELPQGEDAGGSGRADARYGERYGAPGEAAARLFQKLETERFGAGGDVHAFVPVFAARDLAALALAARPWLESRPGARLVVLDHGDAPTRLDAFGRARFDATREGVVNARVETSARRAARWRGAGESGARDARVANGEATHSAPLPGHLPTAQWIAGTFSLDEADPARPDYAVTEHPVAFRVPPPATVCHVGSREAFVSLASLGEGSENGDPAARLSVRSLDPAGGMEETCDALYLADPSVATAAWLARAAAAARAGGVVILEAGPHTDAALWNRSVLAPLGAGRLTEVLDEETFPRATPALGAWRAQRWGNPGAVKKRFGFRVEQGTVVLLETRGAETREAPATSSAVLVERRVGAGRLLVWTTSLSDTRWSGIGLGPWAALAHQAVLTGAGLAGGEERRVDSDSIAWWPASGRADEAAPRVYDPAGRPFTPLTAEAGGWTFGPFPRVGLYRIVADGSGGALRRADSSSASSWLAVTLAPPPPAPRAADWAAFEEALGPAAWAQTRRLSAHADWRSLYGGVPLRTALLALAALLLFAEGVVSLRLARTSRREG